MSNTRNSPSKNPKRNILFFKATYRQWKIDTGHDLSTLVGKDLLELIDGTETNNLDKTENRKHTKLSPWRESSLLKGELLIKIVFFIATNYTHLLSRDAWSSVIMLLLFARSRGVLPEQIAVISDDFKENLNNIELINESLIPSVYARQAFLRAYGHIVSTPKNLLKQSGKVDRVSAKDILSKSELRISQSQANNTVNSSMSNGSNSDGGKGSWMTSIGGLLWSAASNPSELQQNDSLNKLTKLEEQVARLSEKAGHQFMLNTGATEDNKAVVNLFCNSNACIHIAPSGELLRADDELFKISLSRCHPEDLFINVLAKSSDVVVGNVITSLLNILCNIVYYLLREDNPHRPPSATSDTSSKKTKDNTIEDINIANESHFPDHLLSYEFVDDSVNELDAVVVLQWICLIVFASKSSLKLFWPRVHGKYCFTIILNYTINAMIVSKSFIFAVSDMFNSIFSILEDSF